MAYSLHLNGKTLDVDVDGSTPLLWVLRDHLGLTGTKFGCGIAQCGACTVLMEGDPLRSCAMPVSAVGNREITTIEGAAGPEARAVQAAWIARDVPQCGYCQSGQIMSAVGLLRRVRKPSDHDIDLAMSGNICRCGTYQRIRAAIHDAAKTLETGVSLRNGLFVVMVALVSGLCFAQTGAPDQTAIGAQGLRPVADFDAITDRKARSVALFEEAGKVITSPRCLNCHPVSERPTQTDAMQPHQPWVVRGADGVGAPGMRCTTCHQQANFDAAGVPGNPAWHLAPASMAWQGKSLGQICAQLKDRARNGNKDAAELVRHSSQDPLVGWGWRPGAGRTPAPGTQAQFGALIKAWLDTGAACPA